MNVFYARPVIAFLIAQITGIYLGSEFPGHLPWAATVAAICAGFIIIAVVRNRTARATPFLFFLTIGYLSLQPWVSPDFPSHHIIHYADSQRWDIVGVVDSRPFVINTRYKFVLRAQRLKYGNEILPVTGKLRVTVAGEGPQLHVGDRVLLSSRIRSIRNFNNPGGFDFQRYMAFRGVWGTAYAKGDRVKRLSNRPQQVLWGKIDNVRAHIAKMIENSGKGPQIGVLKALMVGDRSAISQAVREDFNRAGVGHLLAISGLHVGIVATVAFIFFQHVLSNFSVLLWRAWTRKGAAMLALLPICLYGLISGLSPSTQRAVIMISIFLMTFVFEREHDLVNTLALAALVILMIFPPSLFSISFQLSFSAVLSIVFGIKCVQQLRGEREPTDNPPVFVRIRDRLVSFFFVSAFAIGGTLPLVMFYFNQISVVGIFANFFIVPLVGFIVVPLGLIGVFVSPLWLTCAAWCFKACDVVLSLSLLLVEFFADIPFAALKTFTPTVFEIGCYYVLAWSLLYWVAAESAAANSQSDQFQPSSADYHKGRAKKKSGRLTRLLVFIKGLIGAGMRRLIRQKVSGKPHSIAGTLVFITLLVLAADAGYWYYSRFWNNDLKVTFIDVGQGNATLLELPRGYTMLIDGGGFSDNSIFDMGARVLAPLLWRKKIKSIDALILTHPNSDHLNGLIYIAEHFNVRQIWTNNEDRNTFGYRTLMSVVAQEDITMPKFENLARQQMINGVALNIIYPQADFLKKKAADKWRNSNNNSLVVRVSLGSISFLFPGDVTTKAENELVHIAPVNLSSTVLLAPHHGSRSSSTVPFLDSVDPQIVVISAGWKNRFRFPHPDVLKRYSHRGCRIFRIDTHGAVTLITDGQNLAVKPFLQISEQD
jgi:competence protein ComEC